MRRLYMVLIVLLVGLMISCSEPGSIMLNVSSAPMKEIHLRIDSIDEPYYLDFLIEKSTAPSRSQDALNALLPPRYRNEAFTGFVNGYRDHEGFVSYRLYGWNEIIEDDAHSFTIYFQGITSPRYKILLVFEDGSTVISPSILQTEMIAYVTYDMVSIGMQEYPAAAIPEPEDLPANPIQPRFDSYKLIIAVFLISVVLLAELILVFLFGYRKVKSYLIVGSIRFALLVLGSLLFTLHYWIPEKWLTLFFAIAFSIWVIIEAVVLPRWIGEHKMEKTMTFVFSSNFLTMIAIVFIAMQIE